MQVDSLIYRCCVIESTTKTFIISIKLLIEKHLKSFWAPIFIFHRYSLIFLRIFFDCSIVERNFCFCFIERLFTIITVIHSFELSPSSWRSQTRVTAGNKINRRWFHNIIKFLLLNYSGSSASNENPCFENLMRSKKGIYVFFLLLLTQILELNKS